MPESPRWLYANGHPEKAKAMLIKYHGAGDPNSALASFQAEQIATELEAETERGIRKWWDYSILFSSRPMLYRTWLLILTTVFSQFIGGSVIRYASSYHIFPLVLSLSGGSHLHVATTCPSCWPTPASKTPTSSSS
jgi:hypothetical protein